MEIFNYPYLFKILDIAAKELASNPDDEEEVDHIKEGLTLELADDPNCLDVVVICEDGFKRISNTYTTSYVG